MSQADHLPTQASFGTESKGSSSELILGEISQLRNLVTELYFLRQKDVETIQQQAQEIDKLKYQLGRIQEDFNLYYYEPGAQKKFIFIQGNPYFKLKGNYLSRSSKHHSNQESMSATSGEAINNYIEDRFSISVTVQNSTGDSVLGLRTTNQILTTKMYNLPSLTPKSYYQPQDKITMTVDRQKKMVFWYVNNKLTGKQELKIDLNQDIFPYLRLESNGNGTIPQVII